MLFLLIINYLVRSGRLDKLVLLLKNGGLHKGKSVRFSKALFILLCLLMLSVKTNSHPLILDNPYDTFPVPAKVNNQLFYLQRDPDSNTLIYKLNMENGQINTEEPVSVYWIRYAERGQVKELSAIQRKLAYGINSKLIGKGKHELRLVSYPGLPLYLEQSLTDNQYHVYTVIDNKQMILNRVFVHVKAGVLYIPKVVYIELSGKDSKTGKELTHRINI